MRLGSGFAVSALLVTLTLSSSAQVSPAPRGPQTTVALHPTLLPQAFANWTATRPTNAGEEHPGSVPQPRFLTEASHPALEECGPQSSIVVDYTHDGGQSGPVLQATALDFKDASGALAAFSVLNQLDMHDVKGLGIHAAAGEGGVLFVSGTEVVAAYPATADDLPALRALEVLLPKPVGSRGLQPLLPTLLPERGLQPGSLRYALGTRSYMAEGGVLPAAGLGWDKDAEAITARYNDRRGAETLTLLLYPTPTIAGPHQREVDSLLAGLGPSFAHAKTRREGSLVIVADGSFSPDAAQALVENTHLHQFASTDKAMVTPDVVETRKTFGLLANTILFSGLLGVAALLLALFLGGGRALIRILRGKPPATEAEFLSLHLEPQNATAVFTVNEPNGHA